MRPCAKHDCFVTGIVSAAGKFASAKYAGALVAEFLGVLLFTWAGATCPCSVTTGCLPSCSALAQHITVAGRRYLHTHWCHFHSEFNRHCQCSCSKLGTLVCPHCSHHYLLPAFCQCLWQHCGYAEPHTGGDPRTFHLPKVRAVFWMQGKWNESGDCGVCHSKRQWRPCVSPSPTGFIARFVRRSTC